MGAPLIRRLDLPDSGAATADDARRNAPSAARNIAPILEVLATRAPRSGAALEIASGTGQQVARFAEAFPGLDWQPTDIDPANLASIRAWSATARAGTIRPPRLLDAAVPGWAEAYGPVVLVIAVNLLHLISDAEADQVLDGMASVLAPGGLCAIYGPFLRRDGFASMGDAGFDAHLRAQDPGIGYKRIDNVTDRLGAAGLDLPEIVEMPANNLMLLARRPT